MVEWIYFALPDLATSAAYLALSIVGWACVDRSPLQGRVRSVSLFFCAFVFFCGVHHALVAAGMAGFGMLAHFYWRPAMAIVSVYAAYLYLVQGYSVYIPSPKEVKLWKK